MSPLTLIYKCEDNNSSSKGCLKTHGKVEDLGRKKYIQYGVRHYLMLIVLGCEY